MSTISCDFCGEYVEQTNLKFPGYCCPGCRDRDRSERRLRPAKKSKAANVPLVDRFSSDDAA